MAIYFTTSITPLSVNGKEKNKRQQYKNELAHDFGTKYMSLYKDMSLPLTCDVITYLIYIQDAPSGNEKDIDNISKPFIDAFSSKFMSHKCVTDNPYAIYKDDKSVVKRVAVKMNRSVYDQISINFRDVPYEVYRDFTDALNRGDREILLYKVQPISSLNELAEGF